MHAAERAADKSLPFKYKVLLFIATPILVSLGTAVIEASLVDDEKPPPSAPTILADD